MRETLIVLLMLAVFAAVWLLSVGPESADPRTVFTRDGVAECQEEGGAVWCRYVPTT